jgi:hypothetical protein
MLEQNRGSHRLAVEDKKMVSKKTLSIGITVNLENYENLRLEVDGEVATREDALALVAYLDDVLAGMGRNDPATARKIDSYRSRVLSVPGIGREEVTAGAIEEEVAIPAEREEVLIAEHPVMETIHEGDLTESLYHTPADAACVGENSNHAGERVAAEVPGMAKVQQEICECAAQPESRPVEEVPAVEQSVEVLVCSVCGATISRAQEQLSQLFVGRTLCKKCMDAGE